MGVQFNTSESSSLNAEYPKDMAMPNQYGFGGLEVHKIISAASTNLGFVKKDGGSVYGINLHNKASVPAYLRIFDKASAPVDADTPLVTLTIPAVGTLDMELPIGLRFRLGLGFNITADPTDADATAIVAKDVVGGILWR
tara:strand:+ start:9374 stop:9793 length:420 start_codon:yes stop_codon:yes gene_type:complete